jgi:hypothetical protein
MRHHHPVARRRVMHVVAGHGLRIIGRRRGRAAKIDAEDRLGRRRIGAR